MSETREYVLIRARIPNGGNPAAVYLIDAEDLREFKDPAGYFPSGTREVTEVGRKHPVESSCVRRKRGLPGLRGDEHAMIRVSGPLTATGTAYYFVDNMATSGATLAACRAALGFGDGIVWADEGRRID